MRSGSSGMRSSSGRRQMSYNNVDAKTRTNRTFVKRAQQFDKKSSGNRVSYASARGSGNMQRYEKYVPSSSTEEHLQLLEVSGQTIAQEDLMEVVLQRSGSCFEINSVSRSSSASRSSSLPEAEVLVPQRGSGSRPTSSGVIKKKII